MSDNLEIGLQTIPELNTSKRTEGRDGATRSRLVELLTLLYRPEAAESLADDLLAVRARTSVPRACSSNSAMLISYADTVRSSGEVPLRTLGRFLNLHVGEAFGALHLLPFFPSSSDDGFAVIDYRLVDHHVGAWEDIAALAGDYELMFDLVINHCSRESLWFADFVSGREPGRNYFITLPEESDTSAVIRPRSTPLISAVHTYAGIRHVWNTFSDDQIDLDFTNPAVLKEFVEILFFYVGQGARYIRLDAVGFLWKRLGTSCINLPEAHAVVKVLRLLLDEADAGVRLITETNVPHGENVSYFGAGDEAHLVYQFSLAPLLLYSYAFGDASYLTTWAARLEAPPAGATFLNFLASHDGIGLRPLEGLVPEENVERLVELMHERGGFVTLRQVAEGEQKPYEINISLYSAFGGEAENLAAYVGAHALLLSFEGIPGIYIHSLLATANDRDLVEETGRLRSINRGRLDLDSLNQILADPDSVPAQVLDALKTLLARREQQPALVPGSDQHVYPSPPGVFLMRRSAPSQTLFVVASVLDQPQTLELAGLDIRPGTYWDLLADEAVDIETHVELDPYQVRWLDAQAAEVAEP